MESEFEGFGRGQKSFPVKRIYFVSVEGEKTEIQYFKIVNQILKDEMSVEDIEIFPFKSKNGNAPKNVLECMKEKIEINKLGLNDEAWVVIDKDNWPDEQLDEVEKWAKEDDKHGLALSNPFFEFWLLLHFECGNKIKSKGYCRKQLRKHLPNYKKNVDFDKFNEGSIRTAVRHAKGKKDKIVGECRDNFGCTNVYKLIEKCLPSS